MFGQCANLSKNILHKKPNEEADIISLHFENISIIV
jgi:hypothetical protein